MAKKKKYKEYFIKTNETSFIRINFEDHYGNEEIAFLGNFCLKKKRTYSNISEQIIKSNNDIMNCDPEEKILANYLTLKYRIDKKSYETKEEFLEELFTVFVDDELKEIINNFVEENYHFNLDEQQAKSKKKYSEGLIFTDHHCKVFHSIAYCFRLIIPLISQFMFISFSSIGNVNEFLLESALKLFEIFQEDDLNLIGKIFETAKSKVDITNYTDKRYWNYSEIIGQTTCDLNILFTQKILTDNLPKYDINDNVVSFNHVFIKNNLDYNFSTNHPIKFKSMSMIESKSDDSSDFDRFEISNSRVDETKIILSEINIKHTIEFLKDTHKIEVSKEEIDFYKDNFKLNNLQKFFLFLFYSRYFGNALNIYAVENRSIFITLVLLMKKVMEKEYLDIIPKILVAKVDKIKEKKTLTRVMSNKILENKNYAEIMENKYCNTYTNIIESNTIITLLATIVNNKFILNEFNNDSNGEDITVPFNEIVDELLEFIKGI